MRRPLWKQLLVVWAAALALALLLLALDGWFTRPVKFFWLIPYQSDLRGWLRVLWPTFRSKPLTVGALVLVPAAALLATLAAAAAWLVRRIMRRDDPP